MFIFFLGGGGGPKSNEYTLGRKSQSKNLNCAVVPYIWSLDWSFINFFKCCGLTEHPSLQEIPILFCVDSEEVGSMDIF